jgi:hypothetical protein
MERGLMNLPARMLRASRPAAALAFGLAAAGATVALTAAPASAVPVNPRSPANPASPRSPASPNSPVNPVNPVNPVSPANPASPARPIGTTASFGWLRLAHLSPNTPAVDVYLYAVGNQTAKIVLKHVAYGTESPYERVPSGDYTVAMRAAGAPATGKPVLSTVVDVAAGHAYTVAGMGPYKALRLQVLQDRLTTPAGKALIRIIQASLLQQQVSVRLGRKTIERQLTFGTATSYVAVTPGTTTLTVAGGSSRTSRQLSLAAGSVHTLVVLDDPGHLAVQVLEDAAGSTAVPAGPADTGFGGTAAQPGPAMLPWLVAAIVGLLVAGLSAARMRSRRVAAHARTR